MENYREQAEQFAAKHGIKLEILEHDYRPYFDEDKQARDVFKCRISRRRKTYTFEFGQSIANAGQEPCFTKYDPGTFENFCMEFGYDTDSRRAERIYKSVVREYKAVKRLFGDILEELQEIN